MVSLNMAVGSDNPVKVRAAVQAVRTLFGTGGGEHPTVAPIGVAVPSDVPEQPCGDEETLAGARNRAFAVREAVPVADLWIGIEGGIADRDGALECLAWAVVLAPDAREGVVLRGESRAATFTLPIEIAELVRSGVELGTATDMVFGDVDSKRGGGTIGGLTDGAIDRTAYYAHAVALALIPLAGSWHGTGLTFPDANCYPSAPTTAGGRRQRDIDPITDR